MSKMSSSTGPRQSSDHAQSATAGTAPVLEKAPKDRRQNGFHSGGASGESQGDSRGMQGNK